MSDVLVLNKNWQPVKVISVWDAICKVYQEKAKFLDEYRNMHTWDSWINTIGSWTDAEREAKDVIHATSFAMPKPTVIVLTNYSGYVIKKPKMSRRNIYVRDDFTCQYCGKKHEAKYLNIDHVKPKAQGGRTEWTNVVVSCIKCNSHKGARTPAEAGMKLLKSPKIPKWSDIHVEVLKKNYRHWKDLLGDMYWSVELEK